MESTDRTDNIMLNILRKSFPGRRDEQIIPIGLVYAGVRWGKDHRYCDIPRGEEGRQIQDWFRDKNNGYWSMSAAGRLFKPLPRHPGVDDPYFAWLADYLYYLDAESNEEQAGLCLYVNKMVPQDAVFLIALNAARYQYETEPIESWIEDGEPFSAWFEDYVKDVKDHDEEVDEDRMRELYQRVAREMEEYQAYCPNINLADLAWRVPLSIALKKVENKEERIGLIGEFYKIYNEKVM